MSIIEKAIDRLIEDGVSARHRVADEGSARSPESAASPSRPSLEFGAGLDQPAVSSDIANASQREALTPPSQGIVVEAKDRSEMPIGVGPAEETSAVEPPSVVQIYGLELEGLISPNNERSRTAEEFRIIKRPLLQRAFAGASPAGEHQNVLVVTSSVAGEGKTFTSLNLAISIAMELDRTVLLVDADLANPGLSRRLNIKDRPGLIDRLLDDHRDLKDLLLKTDVPKLTVLPAGRQHRRSTELLASNNMKELLDELASRYPDRVVLFDSPPLLATSEASVLANQAGQVVLVIESGTTPQFLVKEAVGVLQNHDRISLVLNKSKRDLLSARGGYYYGYKYGYGYGYGKDNART